MDNVSIKNQKNHSFSVSVVLVRPIYSRNVGATSRAMVNMGFEHLILIDPKCSIDLEARQAAATGQAPLDNREVFSSWEEFHRCYPEGLRWAFSSKDGQLRVLEPWQDVLESFDLETDHFNQHKRRVFLIFGPEDWGLQNEDIQWCHKVVWIPTFGHNPSLNLAQAVLLALYTLRLYWGGQLTPIQQRTFQNDFVSEKDWFCDGSFKKFLKALGMSWEGRRVSVYSALRHYFLRAQPTRREKRMLEIIFEQAARKLSESRRKTSTLSMDLTKQ